MSNETKYTLSKIRVIYTIIMSLWLSQNIYSQFNSIFQDYRKMEYGIKLYGEYELSSNGIKNDLVNKFIYGGYIDEGVKNNSLKKMKSLNNLGGSANYGFSAFIKTKKTYLLLIGYKSQISVNSQFTKDLYQLVFYGNKSFEGKTAVLSNSKFKAQSFQEVYFGSIFTSPDSSAKIGISLSFVGGKQCLDSDFKKDTYLYTAFAGDSLIASTNITSNYTTNSGKFYSFNGIGANCNLFIESSYNGKIGDKNTLEFHVNDLGFINWTKNVKQITSDTSFVFDGVHIDSPSSLKEPNFVTKAFKGLVDSTKNQFSSMLNTSLLLIHRTYFAKNKISVSVGFRYIFNSIYKPYVFSEQEIKLTENISLSMHEGYGGYGKLNIGLSFWYILNKWNLKMGTNQLQGFLLPKTSYGQGLFISVGRKFR